MADNNMDVLNKNGGLDMDQRKVFLAVDITLVSGVSDEYLAVVVVSGHVIHIKNVGQVLIMEGTGVLNCDPTANCNGGDPLLQL